MWYSCPVETFHSTPALPWSRGELWHCGKRAQFCMGMEQVDSRLDPDAQKACPDKQTTPLKCGQVWSIWPARSER